MDASLKFCLGFLAIGMVSTHVAATEVLVFGGTGRLGAPIVQQLVAVGYRVTVLVRPTSDRGRLTGLDVDYVEGDLLDAASLSAALKNRSFGLVIDASARGASRRPFYAKAMDNILHALEKEDVRQFILHGSVGAGDNMQQFPEVGFGRMHNVLLAKGEAEETLKNSGMTWTIIRNGMVLQDGTPATGTATLSEDDSRLEAVTRADLALLTMQCLDEPACFNKTFHAVDDGRQ